MDFDITFGEKENVKYFDRPSAYIIPIKDGKIAVVKIPKGLFLLGGGIEKGETDQQCIERECIEEIGYSIKIGKKIGSAETYTTHSKLGPFHPMQSYYTGELVEKIKEPVERDHELRWMTYEQLKGKMFSAMQNWALDQAVKAN